MSVLSRFPAIPGASYRHFGAQGSLELDRSSGQGLGVELIGS